MRPSRVRDVRTAGDSVQMPAGRAGVLFTGPGRVTEAGGCSGEKARSGGAGGKCRGRGFAQLVCLRPEECLERCQEDLEPVA